MIMDGLQEMATILMIIEEGVGDVEEVKEEEEVEKEITVGEVEEEISEGKDNKEEEEDVIRHETNRDFR